ncbi:MAG: FtsX-like permease family protein [Peptostreptococcaceae bacterium]|nr:FtsX-like permease family protein [Peptostreptococcaceae bacterium]
MNKKNFSILLSVFICSLIFTILGYTEYTQTIGAYFENKRTHPEDIRIENALDEKQIEELQQIANIQSIGLQQEPFSAKIGDHLLEITNFNPDYYQMVEKMVVEGKEPKNSHEILIGKDLKEKLRLNLGDTVTVNFGKRIQNNKVILPGSIRIQKEDFEITNSHQFTIVGFTQQKYHPNMQLFSANGLIHKDGKYYPLIKVKNIFKIFETKKQLDELISRSYHLTPNLTIDRSTLEFFGISEERFMPSIFVSRIAPLLIIAVILVFMVSNVFNIWAIYKIKEFSMYKSIGASKMQIYLLLLKQSITISILPMILGHLSGIGIVYLIYQSMLRKISMIFQITQESFQLNFAVSFAILAIIVLIVMTASIFPARKVSKIDIIDGLKGNLHFKNYKKRQRKNLFSELKVNNRKIFRAQILVSIAGLVLVLLLISSTAIDNINSYLFHKNDSDFNLLLRYSSANNHYPAIFDELVENILPEKHFVSISKYMLIDRERLNYSDAFQQIGFDKKYERTDSMFSLGYLEGSLYGLDKETFEKIGGKGDEILLYNQVHARLDQPVSNEQLVPYLDNVDKLWIKYDLDNEKYYPITIDREISSFGQADKAKLPFKIYPVEDLGFYHLPYQVILITSIDGFNRIIEDASRDYAASNQEFPRLYYNLNLQVDAPAIKDLSLYMDSRMHETVTQNEKYQIRNSIVEKEFVQSQKNFIKFLNLFTLVGTLCLNIANCYSTANLSFFNRKNEIGTLLSCGMDRRELKKILYDEVKRQIAISLIISFSITLLFIGYVVLTVPGIEWHLIVRFISYPFLLFAVGCIAFFNFLIYTCAMNSILKKDILSLIRE